MLQVWFHISQEFKICGLSESVKTHQMVPFTLQFQYLFSFKSPVCGVLSRHADCSNLCNTRHELEVDSFSKPESEKLRENTEMPELIGDYSGALPATCFK